jgi:hypothetical protein
MPINPAIDVMVSCASAVCTPLMGTQSGKIKLDDSDPIVGCYGEAGRRPDRRPLAAASRPL